jgi:transcriptional regulator GlxA family with amidase domain
MGRFNMDPRVVKTIEIIKGSLHEERPFDDLAKSVNLSPSRLRCLFKNEVGVTPAQYLKSLRMERAKELMEGTFLHVKEVMIRIGMSDMSHFVRDFRRVYGLPPIKYRLEHCKNSHRGIQTSKLANK